MMEMPVIPYLDTRGAETGRPPFSQVLLRGQADGGGLFVPEEIPHPGPNAFDTLKGLPYHGRAAAVFEWFGVDVGHGDLLEATRTAYGDRFGPGGPASLSGPFDGAWMLDLWQGPTSAFKDLALQLMPLLFTAAAASSDGADSHLILVATSGDTGKAALEGFADRPATKIAVFFPAEGVSDLQRRQMVTQTGSNTAVFAVAGDFDACQRAVKELFADVPLRRLLRERHGIALSSANSINWGRVLPQIVYYVSAWLDLLANRGLAEGEDFDVCVPTGNFGNILAAWYARRLGVPIARLLCAGNENHVLQDFLETGVYDVQGRRLVCTPSPSMDILVASNLERLLFDIRPDPGLVAGWMEGLQQEGCFEVPRDVHVVIRDAFEGAWIDNQTCLETIKGFLEEHGRLIDPHTAVAWAAARRLRSSRPMLVVSTAHWAKFPADVYRALHGVTPGGPLSADVEADDPIALLRRICDEVRGAEIPSGIAALNRLEERFTEVIPPTSSSVREAVLRVASSQSLR